MSKRLTLIMIGICVLAVLVPIWWWALWGMTPEVGTAWILTGLAVYAATMIVSLVDL